MESTQSPEVVVLPDEGGIDLSRASSVGVGSDVEAVTTEELAAILEKDESLRDANDNRILEEWAFLIPCAKSVLARKAKAKRVVTVEELAAILKKGRRKTYEEHCLLHSQPHLIPEAKRLMQAERLKKRQARLREREEPLEQTATKAQQLAGLIRDSKRTVVYTGAGISTSASAPDFRGPNGVWTLDLRRKRGRYAITKDHDLTKMNPTLSHMAIQELCKRNLVKHVVSQNLDGLHLRSGIPQKRLSDIHGNMYIEICLSCRKQYFRQADVTDHTSKAKHRTGRYCHSCEQEDGALVDTIKLYGEKRNIKWPWNWKRAGKAVKKADLIICIGSSLKTLIRHPNLWPGHLDQDEEQESVESARGPKLVIINLQPTPKDKFADLVIRAKCDLVMQIVLQKLEISIPSYDRSKDPLRALMIEFNPEERRQLGRSLLFESESPSKPQNVIDLIGSEHEMDSADGDETDDSSHTQVYGHSPTSQTMSALEFEALIDRN